jgi:hypothetical protein
VHEARGCKRAAPGGFAFADLRDGVRMGLRERIHTAIQSPVEEATKLIDTSEELDEHTRITLLLNGWFRGISAAVEELATAIEELQRSDAKLPRPEPNATETLAPVQRDEPAEQERAQDLEDASEAQLLEEARASREETEALRREAQSDE